MSLKKFPNSHAKGFVPIILHLRLGEAMESSAPLSIYAQATPMEKLVEQGIKQVPDAYIRTFPRSEHSAELQIPVIDLSDSATADGHNRIVLQIQQACEEWGFFHVIGFGIPGQVLEAMIESTMAFFDLPFEEKMKYYAEAEISPPKITRYGLRFDDVSVADWRDYLIFGSCFPATKEVMNMWPDKPASYRDAMLSYSKEMYELARKILSLISLSLGLKPDQLERKMDKDELKVLCNRYLPCPQPQSVLGLRNHSDPNTITVLLENKVSGLEVLHGNVWVPMNPLPNSLIVNVGDHLEIMSNGRYKSVEHRVLTNTNTTRLSIASFFSPSPETLITPLPELVDEERPSVYNEVSYKEYVTLFRKYSADSKDTINSVATKSNKS